MPSRRDARHPEQRLQERQFTTLGGNVRAFAVDGAFDDCQRLVKEAFADPELCARLQLTSANSIKQQLAPRLDQPVLAEELGNDVSELRRRLLEWPEAS